MTSRIYLFAACVALTLGTPTLAQSTWTVGQDGNADFYNIQDAIDHASHYDTIEVAPGLYEENLNTVGKRITVVSIGGPLVTVIRSNVESALQIGTGETNETVIDGFQFSNCTGKGIYGNNGAAISIRAASPVIKNCKFLFNSIVSAPWYSFSGGAVSVDLGFPRFENCEFHSNQAGESGGAVYIENKSNVSFSDCSFTSNQASRGAAIAVYHSASASLVNCSFEGNIAEHYGGAIYLVDESTCQMQSCTLTQNQASLGAGAVWVQESSLDVTDSVFEQNQASSAGAIQLVLSENCFIVNSQFTDNVALSGNANAIYIHSTKCGIQDTLFCGGTDFITGPWTDLGGVSFLTSCTYGACCSNDVCVDTDEDTCMLFGGEYRGLGTMCNIEKCIAYCPGDLNGNGAVDVDDILLIISMWGPCL